MKQGGARDLAPNRQSMSPRNYKMQGKTVWNDVIPLEEMKNTR